MNALKLVGKELGEVRIAMVGAGAANVAAFRLLTAAAVDPKGIVVCDSGGILHAKHRVSRAWSEAKPCSTKKPAWPSATHATRRRSWQTLFHAEAFFLELGRTRNSIASSPGWRAYVGNRSDLSPLGFPVWLRVFPSYQAACSSKVAGNRRYGKSDMIRQGVNSAHVREVRRHRPQPITD